MLGLWLPPELVHTDPALTPSSPEGPDSIDDEPDEPSWRLRRVSRQPGASTVERKALCHGGNISSRPRADDVGCL